MTTLTQTLYSAAIAVWPWWASSMLKSTAWLAAGMVVDRGLRRRAAGLRHAVATAFALGVPCLWLLNLSPLPEARGWQPARLWMAPPAKSPASTAIGHDTPPPAATTPAAMTTPGTSTRFPGWRAGVLGLWAAGGVVVGIRLLRAWHVSRRCRRQLTAAPPDDWQAWIHEECRRLGLRRIPPVVLGARSPMTVGVLHSIVALPEAARHWPRERWQAVLRHELAHVARRDVRWSLLTELALLPVWPHPLAAMLRHRLAATREQACDDAVVRGGFDPVVYAGHLRALLPGAHETGSPAHLAVMSPRTCAQRFRHLLDSRAARQAVSRRQLGVLGALMAPALLAGTLMVGCATGAATTSAPAQRFARSYPWAIPDLPSGQEPLQVTLQFFEVTLPADQVPLLPAFNDAVSGKNRVLSPEDGWQLYHASRKGTDLLTAPSLILRPGQEGSTELTRDVPVPSDVRAGSPQSSPVIAHWERVPIGVTTRVAVWQGRTSRHIKVDISSVLREHTGFQYDSSVGLELPVFTDRSVDYEGEIENGSFLIIGPREAEHEIERSVPGLGRIPLVGRLFSVRETRKLIRLAAVRIEVARPASRKNPMPPVRVDIIDGVEITLPAEPGD